MLGSAHLPLEVRPAFAGHDDLERLVLRFPASAVRLDGAHLERSASSADTDRVVGVGRSLLPLRAGVALFILIGVTACGGSRSTGGAQDYPLVEHQQPEAREPVTLPNGSVVRLPALPTTYEVEPSPTCEREIATFHDGSQPPQRPVVVPPAPGLRAIALTKHTTRLEWSFRDLPNDCRPVAMLVSVVAGEDPRATPTTQQVKIRGVSGSKEIEYADFLPPPDVARASAYSREGYRSRTVSVLIRRSANTPADPPEPVPPITAPAGEPVSCRGRATVVDDPAGDVLTYATGSPPTRVSDVTPALSAIDITRARFQIDKRTICASFVFARPPGIHNFELTVNLRDTTTRPCCASLRFRQTAGRHEVGYFRVDARGFYQLDAVPNAGASVHGKTLVITGTLPPPSVWQSQGKRMPAPTNIGWSVTSASFPKKYGPHYGDWLPRYEAVGQPLIRQRDGVTVRP